MIDSWKPKFDYSFPRPTAEDRASLEAQIGFTVPDAYWSVVADHQCQIPKPNGVPRPDGRPDEQFGYLLHVLQPEALKGTPYFGRGVLVALSNMAEFYPKGIVPFSDDTGGNNLAFDFRSSQEPPIVFVDHEVAGEAGLTQIAPSFAALLDTLQ